MDHFQGLTTRFLAWFKDSGGVFRDDLLEIRDLRSKGSGRGISESRQPAYRDNNHTEIYAVAKQDIAEDTPLFSIPRDIIINAQTSQLTQKLPEIFQDPLEDGDEENEVEPLGSWGTLILVLIYEHLHGDASPWKPYLDILPQTFETPIFWSEVELKELEGTALTQEKIGKEESDQMLRSRILPIVVKHRNVFYPKGAPELNQEELLSLAHRMGSTIMSYAFDLEGEDEQSEEDDDDGWLEDREGKTLLGMVPMADMLNANAEFNAHLSHGDQLEVTSLRESIPTGSEILNYYGPLPSSDLLRRYGYVTAEHSRYDVVELPWSMVREALGKELQLSQNLIQKIETETESQPEVDLEDVFVIERDSGEPSPYGMFTQPAMLREVSPELEEQVMLFLKIFKKLNGKTKLELKRTRGDDIYNAVVNKVLRARLAQYPHSIEQDEQLLSRNDLTRRHRMAIQVRLGEKRLLQEALALVPNDEEIAQENEGRTTKKPRRTSPIA